MIQEARVRGRRLPVRPKSNNPVKLAGELLISIGEQLTEFQQPVSVGDDAQRRPQLPAKLFVEPSKQIPHARSVQGVG